MYCNVVFFYKIENVMVVVGNGVFSFVRGYDVIMYGIFFLVNFFFMFLYRL